MRRAAKPAAGAPQYVIKLTAKDGADFSRPKFWTGRMLEHWPEYLADPERAHRFEVKQSAEEVLTGFIARGFEGRVVQDR
jgi:hypothetical protein